MTARYSRGGFERRAATYAAREAERRAEVQRLGAISSRRRTAAEKQRLARLREVERARARIERRTERDQQRLMPVERMAQLIAREAERGDSKWLPGEELAEFYRGLPPEQQLEIIQEHRELHEQYLGVGLRTIPLVDAAGTSTLDECPPDETEALAVSRACRTTVVTHR